MRHSFLGRRFVVMNKPEVVSEPPGRVQVSVGAYWRLIILLFAVAAWGLHEEDAENELVSLGHNRQLFQCPHCDRQNLASFDAAPLAEGACETVTRKKR
jgi:hypothetical protein